MDGILESAFACWEWPAEEQAISFVGELERPI